MKLNNEVYGQCPHGENMTTCWECNCKQERVGLLKNDPLYCYFLENRFTGEWCAENPLSNKTFVRTRDPLLAIKFDGDEGRAMAILFLALNQQAGTLTEFIVTEHEFVDFQKFDRSAM